MTVPTPSASPSPSVAASPQPSSSASPQPLGESAAQRAFREARRALHPGVLPPTLPGREAEVRVLREHLEAAFDARQGSVLMMSGMPGTGKTATVHTVLAQLAQSERWGGAGETAGRTSALKFVEVNALRLSQPAHAYMVMARDITGTKGSARYASVSPARHVFFRY